MRRVTRLIGSQLEVQSAVSITWIFAYRPLETCIFDKLSINTGQLGRSFGRVLRASLCIEIPHRAHRRFPPVLQFNFELAIDGRIDIGIEWRGIREPRRRGTGAAIRLLDHEARRGLAIRFSLPFASIGIEVREMAGGIVLMQRVVIIGTSQTVPNHKAFVRSALFDVALFEQTRGQVYPATAFHDITAAWLDILAEQEWRIRPALHVEIIVQSTLNNDVRPGQSDIRIGAGTDVQPIVRLLAKSALTRVYENMGIRTLRRIHNRSTAVVVVRVLDRSAPLDVHLRLHDRFHPVGAHVVGHDLGHMARPLAYLIAQEAVRGIQKHFQIAVSAHAPYARCPSEAHERFPAVLVHELLKLLSASRHRFIPAYANPTRIFAFGVRTLHRIRQTIRMVGGLHRCLRLRA